MTFLCREKELHKLNRRYSRNRPECIIIYGRRRIGKTAIIHEFSKGKPAIYFPALRANAADNLAALSKAIQNYLYPGMSQAPVYRSFDDAFAEITRISRERRLIFAIDELPYLVRADDSIPSRLQHLLDNEWSESGIFLILCGSSMSFMEKEVLSEKSPLFGRRTAQFKMEPLSFLDTARFHPELSPADNALIYGITGGVPHYINKLDVQGSVREALIDNFFDTSAYLFEEPDNLLKQELREPAVYNSIITSIANGSTKLSDIASKAGMESSQCNKYIKTLMSLGIVQKLSPVTESRGRKAIYRLADNFFRFWYRFVPGNMVAISAGTMEDMYDTVIKSYLPDYMGLVFEDMCRQYLTFYADNLPIPIGQIGEWWGGHPQLKKEVQLDVVGLAPRAENSYAGRKFLIGSCKYKSGKIGTGELDLLHQYTAAFTNADDSCFYYIFSKGGFTDGLWEKQESGDVSLVSLEDMYSGINKNEI